MVCVGAVWFSTEKSFSQIRALFEDFSDPNITEGRLPAKLWEYCGKEKTRILGPWQYGDPPRTGQGARTDIATFRADCADGAKLTELQEKHAGIECRHPKYFDRVIARSEKVIDDTPQRQAKPYTIVIWGAASGVGKTHVAHTHASEGGRQVYCPAPARNERDMQWWDGYMAAHDAVVFDEFADHMWGRQYFNNLCDGGPLRLDVKGGFVTARFKLIVFTSNDDPARWWNGHASAQRRMDEVWRVEYGEGHGHNKDYSNAVEVWQHASWTCERSKETPPRLSPALYRMVAVPLPEPLPSSLPHAASAAPAAEQRPVVLLPVSPTPPPSPNPLYTPAPTTVAKTDELMSPPRSPPPLTATRREIPMATMSGGPCSDPFSSLGQPWTAEDLDRLGQLEKEFREELRTCTPRSSK